MTWRDHHLYICCLSSSWICTSMAACSLSDARSGELCAGRGIASSASTSTGIEYFQVPYHWTSYATSHPCFKAKFNKFSHGTNRLLFQDQWNRLESLCLCTPSPSRVATEKLDPGSLVHHWQAVQDMQRHLCPLVRSILLTNLHLRGPGIYPQAVGWWKKEYPKSRHKFKKCPPTGTKDASSHMSLLTSARWIECTHVPSFPISRAAAFGRALGGATMSIVLKCPSDKLDIALSDLQSSTCLPTSCHQGAWTWSAGGTWDSFIWSSLTSTAGKHPVFAWLSPSARSLSSWRWSRHGRNQSQIHRRLSKTSGHTRFCSWVLNLCSSL